MLEALQAVNFDNCKWIALCIIPAGANNGVALYHLCIALRSCSYTNTVQSIYHGISLIERNANIE